MGYTLNEGFELRDHQQSGVNHIKDKNLNKYALFMGVGTGKTITSLELLKDKNNILVITTSKLYNTQQWEEEAMKFYSRDDLTVINYEKISGTKGKPSKHFDELLKNIKKYEAVIVDEVHKVSSSSGKGAKGSCKFVAKLTKIIPTVVGLTGTPVKNSYCDVFHMLRNLDIHEFNECKNAEEFIMTYYNYYAIPLKWGRTLKPTTLKTHRASKMMDKIDSVSYTYMPNVMDHTLNIVEINEPLPDDYIDVTQAIMEDDTLSIFSKMALMQQLSNGFRFNHDYVEAIDKKTGEPILKKVQDGYTIVDTHKKEAFRDIVKKNTKDNFIFVYKFIPDLDAMTDVINDFKKDDIDINHTWLHISQSEAQNLQEYNHIIFYSLNYSFKDYDQMRGRILRDGQTQDCKITILKRINTIEDSINDIIDNKKTASDLYKEYIAEKRK